MRATRHDPRVPQLQMIDKEHQQLALGILTSLFTGIGYASSGGAKKVTGSTPPINASSKDEADFIQYVASFVLLSGLERARETGHIGNRLPDEMHPYKHSRHMLTSRSLQQAIPQGKREEGSQALDSGRQKIHLIRKSDRKAMGITSQSHRVCIYTLPRCPSPQEPRAHAGDVI